MGVLLGLLCALGFGSGDYLGGRATRTSPAPAVVLVMQLAGATGIAVVIAVYHPSGVSAADITRGAVAGAIGCIGLGLLYWLLAHRRAAVVAPITSVVATLMPVAWGFVRGERPSGAAIAGIVVALIGITLVSGLGRGPLEGVGLSVVTGALFGATLILFASTSHSSGLWPVFAGRWASVVAVIAFALVTRRLTLPTGSDRTMSAAAGVLDTAGNVFVQLAVRHGLLSVVAPLFALGPAVTVLLTRGLDGEQVGVERAAGIALSIVGVALLSLG